MVPTPPGPHASRPQKPYPTETKTPPPPTPQLEARNRRRVGGGVPVPVPSVVRPVRPPPRRLPPPSVSTVSPARLFSSTSNHQAAAHTRRDPDASADSDQQPLATSPSPVSDATRPAAAAMGSVDFGLVEIHPGEIRFEFEVKKKIIMQAQMIAPPDLQIRDKFLVQTTIVPFGTADEDIAPAFFSKEVGRYIEENKLRVVLVSATQLEEQQLIAGVPSAKTGVEVRVAKETLNIESEASNVTNEVHHSLKTNFPPLRENPATLNEMPFPVKQTTILAPSKEVPAISAESAHHWKETPAESLFSSNAVHHSLKTSFPPLRENPATLNEMPFPVKQTTILPPSEEVPAISAESGHHWKETPAESLFATNALPHSLKTSYLLRENPAILNEIPFPVRQTTILPPSKEVPVISAESAHHWKETLNVPLESHFSSTETNVVSSECPETLENTSPSKEFAILRDTLVNAENLHYVTDDVQNLMTKLSNLEAKLEEAESVIVKLREDTRTTIRERDKLKHEMVVLTRKGASRSQAGFPLLFVVYMAILGASLGYLLHL
uniref:MSP domain-containing protein n=1 Tax=Oryza rufipogon TaxID=4529 RepID=A0A0E0PLM8_ORYRU